MTREIFGRWDGAGVFLREEEVVFAAELCAGGNGRCTSAVSHASRSLDMRTDVLGAVAASDGVSIIISVCSPWFETRA